MALSGSFYNYPANNFGLYCEWSGSQSIGGNYTDITLNVYLKYWSLSVGERNDSTISINGQTETYTVPAINHYPNTNYTRLLKTKTVRVYHNNDGTKSCTLSASWRMSGTYSGVSVGTITASTTVTLDTIARASSITSASNITLGNACNVSWTPASSGFRYKLKFAIGSWSYTTDYISPNRTSSYTYTGYTIPLTVANQLPKATNGTMTATLYTYNGSSQIGSASAKTFTVTVPSTVIPTVNTPTVTIDNSANSVVAGWGIYVAGYSKAKITATASGSYGSTISSFTVSGGYSATQSSTSLNYTGGAFTTSGSKTFTVVAKDSRGRSSASKITSAITVYAYSKPKVSSFSVRRSDTNAKKMIVKANWTFASVNNKNSANAILYYKKSTATGWTNYGTITKDTDVTLTNEFDEALSYNFKVVVTDALSESAQEETFVSTISVLLDFRAGGKGLGVGKIAETDKMEVALDALFLGEIYIKSGNNTLTLADYIKSLV